MTYEPQPGDYGVQASPGFLGWAIRLLTRSRWNHAFVYIGNGRVVEAEASGAVIDPLHKRREKVVWNSVDVLTDEQRQKIVSEAYKVVDARIGYNYLDILALALEWGLGVRWGWLRDRVQRQDRMICSQLVDTVYQRAGVRLFDDGRLPQEVTPGDLAERLLPNEAPQV